ncbi:coiled coil-containing protein [Cryptosporidium canis]|uniref:Coiled coil-containing protein n=1 Tax=Cryptosporidium canis TaxID=195482 RepID=A0ABQ8P7J9_9CRYT|nr:coiled coil-containing protein [Cryptosporidium canis]
MQFNYDDPYNNKIDGFVEFESELAKLREETSSLYKNEYVRDFLENYHLEINQAKENRKEQQHQKAANAHAKKNSHSATRKSTNCRPYSYDVGYSNEYEGEDCFVNEGGGSSRRRGISKNSVERNLGNDKDRRGKKVNKPVGSSHNDGLVVFSRKYGVDDTDSRERYLTLDISEIKGDIIKSPKKNSKSKKSELSEQSERNFLKYKTKRGSPKLSKKTVLFQDKKLLSQSPPSSLEVSEDEYKSEIDKYKKHYYTKDDEKIKYYLNQSSLEDDSGDSAGESSDDKSGLAVSNSFLSKLPSSNQVQAVSASQKYEQNERDILMKRIQSLEVIESSQKMLILETQNKEQQYRIRSEELQKQLEYKDTKLLLLNQDYDILKRDFDLLKDEKEVIRKKFTEMETHWNEEYGRLYKYKVDYEILNKQNETLMVEKKSFVNMIEEDKERYRKMELSNTNLLLNVDNLEKRNHEIVERCSKLQEDNDSLSREYNKLYHKYTALLSEYGASKKNEENLNAALVELQDTNKRLNVESKDMRERYKTLSDTERALEQLQESNTGLIGEVSALKEERDILSADYKILEKKFKASEESIHEMRNQLLDFTLENQKLKKLIKQTIIPLIPDVEYNSTIGHILTVLNAKENSRMSIKVLEEEYLNNSSAQSGKGKSKEELQAEATRTWNGVESPFSPKKIMRMMNGLSLDHHCIINNVSLSPKPVKTIVNNSSPSPKSRNNKLKDPKNDKSPKSNHYYSNLNKFERLSPKNHNNMDDLKTRSLPVFEIDSNGGDKKTNPKLYNSCPVLDNDKDKESIVKPGEKEKDTFKRGVQVQTPRPFVAEEDDHTIPVVLPKKLEGKISKVLQHEDEVIPVIPENHPDADERDLCKGDIILEKDSSDCQLDHEPEKVEKEDLVETNTKDNGKMGISDSIKMIDNYEKQILLLNVEKVQLEAELTTLPKDNWSSSAKEKENKDNIERRLLEIQNSIVKASSNIKSMKEKQLTSKDHESSHHRKHNNRHHKH